MAHAARLTAVLTVIITAGGCASTTGGDDPIEKRRQAYLGSTDCQTASLETGFNNVFYPQQQSTTPFEIGFNVQPRMDGPTAAIDGVVGLSNGPADAFADLGPIVRFNPSGFVDARNGGTYMADNVITYYTDWPFYHVRMSVNLGAHTYSAWINEHGFPEAQIATDYAFRTEQQAVPRLDALGSRVDSEAGWMQVCELRSVDAPPSGAPRCEFSSATSGWTGVAFPAQSDEFSVQFDVEPAALAVDAVVGVSAGPASSFRDLAAIFRFNPDGYIDVRNGDVYAADNVVAYEPGRNYRVTMHIHPATGRYDVTIPTWDGVLPLATDYAFRTEAQATAFDNVRQFVDGQGYVNVCDVVVSY